MSSIDKTMKFNFSDEPYDQDIKSALITIHEALEEKVHRRIQPPRHPRTLPHPHRDVRDARLADPDDFTR